MNNDQSIVNGLYEFSLQVIKLKSINEELLEALQMVVKVADRKTIEFDKAHEAIAKATGNQA